MKVHEVITALMGEDPHTEVAIHTDGKGWTLLDKFESADDPTNECVVPSFSVDPDAEYLDVRFDGHMSPNAATPDSGLKAENGVNWITDPTPEQIARHAEALEATRAVNRQYNAHLAMVAGDHAPGCECEGRCAFCAVDHYPTHHDS